MLQVRLGQSLVIRLIACLVLVGAVLAGALGALEWRETDVNLQIEVVQHLRIAASTTEALLSAAKPDDSADNWGRVSSLLTDPLILAVRLTRAGSAVEFGNWSAHDGAATRLLTDSGLDEPIALDSSTIVRVPLTHAHSTQVLELLIDPSHARRQSHRAALVILIEQWLAVAAAGVIAAFLLWHGYVNPLTELRELIATKAGPESFYRFSRHRQGEFSQLASAVAGMLTRIDSTAQELRQSKRAGESLYQFAPAAMLTLNRAGKIVDANRRAAEMLRTGLESDLVDQAISDFVRVEDRSLLRQALERLEIAGSGRCELRLSVAGRELDTVAEFAAVRDEEGRLARVRLSLQDVTASRELHREFENKRALLNLIVNHVSDAVVLVDANGRVAAHNQRLTMMLNKPYDTLVGRRYDAATFWESMGAIHEQAFLQHLQRMQADNGKPTQERIVTRCGVYLFQSIPVQNALGQSLGRLWVVQEITSQEQSQRLVDQQAQLLLALRHMGQQLSDVADLDQLLTVAGQLLHDIFGVEAVGIALRYNNARRTRQVIHRGAGPYLIETHGELTEQIAKQVMPRILSQTDVTLWPELPRREAWSDAWQRAGLSSLAGIAMRGRNETQGILWIAQGGGERIERYHIHMLETLAPVLAARIEIAQLCQQRAALGMTDPITELASRKHVLTLGDELCRAEQPWSLVLLQLDGFRAVSKHLGAAKTRETLREIGAMLPPSLRAGTLAAHIDAATFALVCPGADPPQAEALAQRLQHHIADAAMKLFPDVQLRLSVRHSAAHFPADGATVTQVLRCGEKRLEAGCGEITPDAPAPVQPSTRIVRR